MQAPGFALHNIVCGGGGGGVDSRESESAERLRVDVGVRWLCVCGFVCVHMT